MSGKRILVLGGSGLVGRNVIESLISRGVRNITAIGLPREAAWRELQKIERKHRVRIRKYSVNLLVPPKFQRQTLVQILSSPSQRRRLTQLVTIQLTYLEVAQQPIAKVIKTVRPHLIVDCINIATQCAYIDQARDGVQNAGIGSLLLVRYYQVLYHLLRKDFWQKPRSVFHIEQYLKVGTTGVGGMGFDIPFTHGEERPSISLMKKVAMAGAQTNILLAMRHSHKIANIQEIVPTTSVFQMSDFTPTSSNGPAKRRRRLIEIDGGESRGYALEEFRLLTHRNEMGVVDAQELAELILRALHTGRSHYDVLKALEKAGVGSSYRSTSQRDTVLAIWTRDLLGRREWNIAHGNLGPWRTRKLLFELSLLLTVLQRRGQQFWEISPQKLQSELWLMVQNDLALRAEIRSAHLRVTQAGRLGNSPSSEHFIDLSINNLKRWRKVLRHLSLRSLYAGDVLAELVQKHRDFRVIP